MVDDGRSVGLRPDKPSSAVSSTTESQLETESKKTESLADSHKIIAFKVSHVVVSLIVLWFW